MKKLLSFVIILSLVLTLAACGEPDEESVNDNERPANDNEQLIINGSPEPTESNTNNANADSEWIEMRLENMGITDAKLAEMVASGEIPANINGLFLHDNLISDITPLSGLPELDGLWIWGNQISDLSPLSGLSKLHGLWISGNQISDLTPLTGMNVKWLHLAHNQISDITPLHGLTSLEDLELQGNPNITQSAVDSLQAALPNTSIKFREKWTLHINGEPTEVNLTEIYGDIFMPLHVLRHFGAELSINYTDLSTWAGGFTDEVTEIRVTMPDVESSHTFYYEFVSDFDENGNWFPNYELYKNHPTLHEIDGVLYIRASYFEQGWGTVTSYRREHLHIYLEGITDSSVDPAEVFIMSPRPTEWTLNFNGSLMPHWEPEILFNSPGYATIYITTTATELTELIVPDDWEWVLIPAGTAFSAYWGEFNALMDSTGVPSDSTTWKYHIDPKGMDVPSRIEMWYLLSFTDKSFSYEYDYYTWTVYVTI